MTPIGSSAGRSGSCSPITVRAWIAWRQARTVADRLGVLFEAPFRSMEAVRAWKAIKAATQRCLHLRVPGPNWRRELDLADEQIARLEPEWSRVEGLAELKSTEASGRLR